MINAPSTLENQLQHERIARAQAALQRGEMQVIVLTDCTWMVASKGNRYAISLEDDAWTCTCLDFSGRCQRFGLRCKHIEAVRFTETSRNAESRLESQYTKPTFLNNPQKA